MNNNAISSHDYITISIPHLEKDQLTLAATLKGLNPNNYVSKLETSCFNSSWYRWIICRVDNIADGANRTSSTVKTIFSIKVIDERKIQSVCVEFQADPTKQTAFFDFDRHGNTFKKQKRNSTRDEESHSKSIYK